MDYIANFTAKSLDQDNLVFNNIKAKYRVLYFYPKDNTSGCSKQAAAFTENYDQFKALDAEIIGVSKDSLKSHQKFREKYNIPFDLISDESTELCQACGVWKEKSMYGRKYMGVERTTFLIAEDNKILYSWPKVKVAGHVEEVLAKIKELESK